MTTDRPPVQSCIGRPNRFSLGLDSEGYRHWRHTPTQRVVLIDTRTGERVRSEYVPDGALHDWMEFVDEDLLGGWARRDYGVGIAALAAEAVAQ